jgi:hypothetical protein
MTINSPCSKKFLNPFIVISLGPTGHSDCGA